MKNKKAIFFIVIISFIAGFFALYPTIPLINRSYQLGLDLQGGVELSLEADMKDIEIRDQDAALDSAKSVIERRVNFLGVSEPVIQTAKVGESRRVIVELPGVKETEEAIKVVGATAELQFWEEGKPTDVTGRDLKRAFVSFDPQTGKPEVGFELTGEGGKKFASLTKRILEKKEEKRQLAIVLDGEIISAPTVQSVIEDKGRITGQFTTKEAKALSIQLNAGALPVPLRILRERSIGATLGEESVQKSLIAGAVGFFLVVSFMIFFYRTPGIFAVLALIIYTLIVLAMFKLISVTLTLAGIAAFILSVGMAVDANILIFERFREEIRWGKPKHVALEAGFARAWSSIRDSNISSLITAGILYYFGTGQVRGFALVLAIGVVVSMFSAIVVTRTFLRMAYGHNR